MIYIRDPPLLGSGGLGAKAILVTPHQIAEGRQHSPLYLYPSGSILPFDEEKGFDQGTPISEESALVPLDYKTDLTVF